MACCIIFKLLLFDYNLNTLLFPSKLISIRVGDDFGKFRLQYESQSPWIGMHGSFVVCSNAVERAVGFNHGIRGSITEDAYFALVAWARYCSLLCTSILLHIRTPCDE